MTRDWAANAVLAALVDQLPQLKAPHGLVVADVQVALTLKTMIPIAALMDAALFRRYLVRAVRRAAPGRGRISARVVASHLLECVHQLVGGEGILP